MEQKRPRRKARAAQKRYYESIDTSYQNADPIAVQQVHEVYAGSAKTGSIIASPAAVPVAPITLDSVSGNIYEVANGNLTQNGRLGRDNRFGFVVLATTRVYPCADLTDSISFSAFSQLIFLTPRMV